MVKHDGKHWFGKGCRHLCAVWEENEYTGGPDYREYEPELMFCNHPKNPEDSDGNCRPAICPLNRTEHGPKKG